MKTTVFAFFSILLVLAFSSSAFAASYSWFSRSSSGSWGTRSSSVTLRSLTISGPSSVNESSKATYTATATWSNGSVTAITPTWSVNSASVTINSSGALTSSTVNSNQTVTVTARYSSGGIVRSATKSVSIVDVQQAPSDPILPAQITLSWDPSADPQVVGYRLYYKESYADDPSFKSLPFDSTSLFEGDSPLDVGKKATATLNLPYDTTVFCFAVTGYNSAGLESDYSNIACTSN